MIPEAKELLSEVNKFVDNPKLYVTTRVSSEIADMNYDGIITGSEVGMFLQERVSFDTDNFQTPQVKRFTFHEGEMIFIPQKAGYSKRHSESLSIEEQLQAALQKIYEKTFVNF